MEPMELEENSSRNQEEENRESAKQTDEIPKKKAKYESNELSPEQSSHQLKQQEQKWYGGMISTREYMIDIYKNWVEIQKKDLVKPNYMKKQTSINHDMRSELIDWLANITDSLNLPEEVLFLSVHYIDRFLSHLSIMQDRFQLLGIVAFHIAAKFEDSFYETKVSYLLSLTENSFDHREFLYMEQLVLKLLRFDLSHPTPSGYLNYLASLYFTLPQVIVLAMYFCELSLLDGDNFLEFPVSMIACASLALSRYNHGHKTDIWTQYEGYTGYTFDHLKSCMYALHLLRVDACKLDYQNIQLKYRDDKYFRASLMETKELSENCLDILA